MARSTYFYHQARLNQPDKYAQLKEAIIKVFTELSIDMAIVVYSLSFASKAGRSTTSSSLS